MSDYYYPTPPDDLSCLRVQISIANGLQWVKDVTVFGSLNFGCEPEDCFGEDPECGIVGYKRFCQPVICDGDINVQIFMEERIPYIFVYDIDGVLLAVYPPTETFNNYYDFTIKAPCNDCFYLELESFTVGDELVENGDFSDGSDGWIIIQPLFFTYTTTNETTAAANDGTITVTGKNGTAPYEYSKDGGMTYQASNVFSGLGADTYNICIRDANLTVYCEDVVIYENVDCGIYKGLTLQQVIDTDVVLGQVLNCTLTDFIP